MAAAPQRGVNYNSRHAPRRAPSNGAAMGQDYYAVLGLGRGASTADIQRA